MEFPGGAGGFKLFGKVITTAPINYIQPPDDPLLQLQLATPSSKQEDSNQATVVIKRLVNELNRKRFPLVSDPAGLELVLQKTMKVSSNPRLTHFFTRTLFQSDVEKGLARLTIPHNRILRRFLNDDEEKLLQQPDGKRNGLRVQVIDPKLVVYTLNLTRWNYAKKAKSSSSSCSCSYVLNGGWNNIVHGNGLSAGNILQVWSFRKMDDSLAFIIFKH